MVALDIGANIGAHTIAMSKMVGRTGMVYAFEPERIIFQTLAGNMAINSITNVYCFNKGVGKEKGTAFVPVFDYNTEDHYGVVELSKQGLPVEIITIDSLSLPRCDFIKADVEGMELEVLQGAEKTIKEFNPVLYIENDRKEKAEDLMKYISSLEYNIYWHSPPLFNKQNFFGNSVNVFGESLSKNILCLPVEDVKRHKFRLLLKFINKGGNFPFLVP